MAPPDGLALLGRCARAGRTTVVDRHDRLRRARDRARARSSWARGTTSRRRATSSRSSRSRCARRARSASLRHDGTAALGRRSSRCAATRCRWWATRPRRCRRSSWRARSRSPTRTVLLRGESGTGKDLFARTHPRAQPARRRPVGQGQLRRAARGAARERAVRPREGRVHRRGAAEARPLRGRARRHAVPGRDRRAAARRCRSSCCR